MKILVFVKQVPETDDVKLDKKTGNLIRDGVKSILNPLDANAIEAALQLKAKCGGSVAAVSMGPPQSEEVLKKALGMGCDEAYLLSDRAFGGADTLATAYTLAMAAKKIGDYDLLLFGKNASDGDTAQTGPAVAAWLDVPQVTLASAVDSDGQYVYCERKLDDCIQKVKVALPCVVTVTGDANKPRYATPINIMKAQKKPRTTWSAADLGADTSKCGTPGSPSRTKSVFEPKKASGNAEILSGSSDEKAASLVKILESKNLL